MITYGTSMMERSPLGNDYWWHKHNEHKAFSDAKKNNLAKWIVTPVGYAAAMEAKKDLEIKGFFFKGQEKSSRK